MNLNKEDLVKIARKSPTAEAIFTVLGARERARTDMDLRRLRNELVSEGFKVIPAEFEAAFAELARAGVVDMEKKAGKATRVRFLLNPVTVGRAGIDGRPAKPALAPVVTIPIQPPIPARSDRALRVVCVLGAGRQAQCDLPESLSHAEAKILAEAILQQAVG